MLALEIERTGLGESPIAIIGRWGSEAAREDCQADLWLIALELAPHADLQTLERIAEAVSLRGAALVQALLYRFADTDEAIGALEDYAGAFDSLRQFQDEVRAEHGADCSEAAPVNAETMIARGEIFTLTLGADLHVFWTV